MHVHIEVKSAAPLHDCQLQDQWLGFPRALRDLRTENPGLRRWSALVVLFLRELAVSGSLGLQVR